MSIELLQEKLLAFIEATKDGDRACAGTKYVGADVLWRGVRMVRWLHDAQSAQNLADRLRVGHDCIPHVLHVCHCMLGCFGISSAASIGDDNWNVTQIRAVPDCRRDADFSCDAHNNEGVDCTVAKGDIQRGALKRGHRNFVEYG